MAVCVAKNQVMTALNKGRSYGAPSIVLKGTIVCMTSNLTVVYRSFCFSRGLLGALAFSREEIKCETK